MTTRYVMPDRRTVRDVEGVVVEVGSRYTTVDGVEYGVESVERRLEDVAPGHPGGPHRSRPITVVKLRDIPPGEALMRRQAKEPAAPRVEVSPRHRIARLFVDHEDVSPSDDVVVVVRRGVDRAEWARQLRKLADAEVAEEVTA